MAASESTSDNRNNFLSNEPTVAATAVITSKDFNQGQPVHGPVSTMPRKCSASKRTTGTKDHTSIQMNVAEADETGNTKHLKRPNPKRSEGFSSSSNYKAN
ncbi:hypothetical protein GH733_017625 [Mirounga leonina]|nr:hypothetical protein GH733_017625 [Mirounga leonina]